ncbi:MAG: mechanosensitive ion channel family protein [Gemmatimonadota bacterium]
MTLPDFLTSPPDWARGVPWSAVGVALLLLTAWIVWRVLTRQVAAHVADAEKRHQYRKRVGYSVASVVVVILGIAFFERIQDLGTLLGFLGAGLAIALREYLAAFLAWFYILGQRHISIGNRIEVGGVRGDVIDIGVLKLTLVEVRGEGFGEQSSGRLVTVPNFKVLTEPVFHFTAGSPFVWDEIEFQVTFESNWERARELLEQAGREIVEPHAAEITAGFQQLENAYAFRYGITTPIVYVSVQQASGVCLRLRYLTHVRQRRTNRDAISQLILKQFAAEPDIEFAYPTSRVYRHEIDSIRFGESPPL